MKSQGCLWDERCSKHLESLEKTVFFLNGRGLYSLGGGNPNGCCAGSEFGRAGSAECRSGHTRGHCAHYCITLLYYCTIIDILSLLHTCTIGLYCSLLQAKHFIILSYYCTLLQFIDFIALQCTIPHLHICIVVHTTKGVVLLDSMYYCWVVQGWFEGVGVLGEILTDSRGRGRGMHQGPTSYTF